MHIVFMYGVTCGCGSILGEALHTRFLPSVTQDMYASAIAKMFYTVEIKCEASICVVVLKHRRGIFAYGQIQ